MNHPSWPPRKVLAVVLIAVGVLGLVYGGITITTGYHNLDLGVTELWWRDRDTLHIPVWLGVAAVVAGALLLLNRKSSQAGAGG